MNPTDQIPDAGTPRIYPHASAIAEQFCLILQRWLGTDTMIQVIMRNKAEENGDICHSHDFCDANEAMHEAFVKAGIDPLSTGIPDTDYALMDQECYRLWDAAWTIAKERDFIAARVVADRGDVEADSPITAAEYNEAEFPDELRELVKLGQLVPLFSEGAGLRFDIASQTETRSDALLVWHFPDPTTWDYEGERFYVTRTRYADKAHNHVTGNEQIPLADIEELVSFITDDN